MTTIPSPPRQGRVVPVTPEPSNRLTFDDEVFLRSETVMKVPAIGQNAWRFPGTVPVERVRELAATLARGPFGRIVLRSRVPGARARWIRSSLVPPVRVAPEPIDPAEVSAWLRTTFEVPLDAFTGPLFAFFVAYTTDGHTIVVLNVSHVMADGRLKLDAVAAAVEGRSVPPLPVADLAASQVTLADDVRDGAHMVVATAKGLADLVRRGRNPAPRPDVQTSAGRPVPSPAPGDDLVEDDPFVAADCPADQWHRVATEAGGTANGLLIAVTVEILLEAGIAEAGRPVKVALPVAMRGEDDWRSNATSGVSIVVDTELRGGVGRVTDLAHIRARSKAEFSALYDGTRVDPTAPLRPLLQVIPDRAARVLAASITSPLCLASNLGHAAPAFAAPFGIPAEAILYRGESRGATRGELRRLRGGVTAWCGQTDTTWTYGVRALDPDAVPDDARLREIVTTVYQRWGLTPSFW